MHKNIRSPNFKRIAKSFLNHEQNSYVILEKETLISRNNLGNYLTVLLNYRLIRKIKRGKRAFFILTDRGKEKFNNIVNKGRVIKE